MHIQTSRTQNIPVLHLSGELLGGPEAMQLREEVNRLLDSGEKRLLLDFANVERMNSSGLGILINTVHTFQENGGVIKLANLNKRLQQLITVTRLQQLFDVYDSIDAALASF